LQEAADVALGWSIINNMQMNIDKTKCMKEYFRRKQENVQDIVMQGRKLEKVKTEVAWCHSQ